MVVGGTGAGLGTVLSVQTLRTVELTASPAEARLALAPAVHLVTARTVVAETGVGAVWPEAAHGTRLGAVLSHEAARTAALPRDVMAVPAVSAGTRLDAAFPEEAGIAGPGAVRAGVARRADTGSREAGTGPVRSLG